MGRNPRDEWCSTDEKAHRNKSTIHFYFPSLVWLREKKRKDYVYKERIKRERKKERKKNCSPLRIDLRFVSRPGKKNTKGNYGFIDSYIYKFLYSIKYVFYYWNRHTFCSLPLSLKLYTAFTFSWIFLHICLRVCVFEYDSLSLFLLLLSKPLRALRIYRNKKKQTKKRSVCVCDYGEKNRTKRY